MLNLLFDREGKTRKTTKNGWQNKIKLLKSYCVREIIKTYFIINNKFNIFLFAQTGKHLKDLVISTCTTLRL